MKPQKSCTSCKRRKQKCDLKTPCSRCVSLKIACNYISPDHFSRKFFSFEEAIKRIKEKEVQLMVTYNSLDLFSDGPITPTLDSTDSFSSFLFDKGLDPLCSQIISCSPPDTPIINIQNLRNQLFETYFSLTNKIHNLIKEDRVRSLLDSRSPEDEVLVSAIAAFSFPIYNYVNSLPKIHYTKNFYYIKARSLVSDPSLPYSINVVQALLLLVQIESAEGLFFESSLLLAKAIRISQALGYHTFEYNSSCTCMEPLKYEGFKAWCVCMTLDLFFSRFFSKPHIVQNNIESLDVPLPKDTSLSQDFKSYMLLPHCELDVGVLFVFGAKLNYEYSSLKIELAKNNDVLSISTQIKEMIAQLEDLEKYPIMTCDLTKLFPEDIDILSHPIYLTVISCNLTRLSLLCDMFYTFHQILDSIPNADFSLAIEALNESRRYGILIYRISAKMQKKYEELFSSRLSVLFYLLDLSNVLYNDLAQTPFKNDASKSSRKLLLTFKENLNSVAKIWPLFKLKNPAEK